MCLPACGRRKNAWMWRLWVRLEYTCCPGSLFMCYAVGRYYVEAFFACGKLEAPLLLDSIICTSPLLYMSYIDPREVLTSPPTRLLRCRASHPAQAATVGCSAPCCGTARSGAAHRAPVVDLLETHGSAHTGSRRMAVLECGWSPNRRPVVQHGRVRLSLKHGQHAPPSGAGLD